MQAKRRARIWVKAEMTCLTEVSRFVQEWLSGQDGYRSNRKERYLVELAAVEACTNVIRYAYPASLPGDLGVCLKREGSTIEVLLLDRGSPFDPTRFQADTDLQEPRDGGYGIYLMRRIMQDVTYQRIGSRWNCLRLVRDVPRGTMDENEKGGLAGLRDRIVSGEERVR